MAEDKPLHVLIVRFGSKPITFLNRLVTGLADSGVQVSIAGDKKVLEGIAHSKNINLLWAPSWRGGIFLRTYRVLKLLVTNFSLNRLNWIKDLLQKAKSPRETFSTLYQYLPFMKGEWDLIYFPWNSTAIDYTGLYQLGIPVLVSCRGSQVNIRPHLPGQKSFSLKLYDSLQKASFVHCVSEDLKQSILELGIPQDKCFVIRPAIDPDYFTPSPHPPKNERFKLVTTGSLIWRKSYEIMLLAFKQLLDAGLDGELHIIGKGPERENILFMIHDLGLEDCVGLHGQLTPDQVREQLQKADCFLLSSLSEGIANAALEAMSCGLPVVTTDCGGMREAVTDGVEGFVVPIRDPKAMSKALSQLALSPDLRQKMGTAGRERVISNFKLEDQIDAFTRLFQSLTGPKR